MPMGYLRTLSIRTATFACKITKFLIKPHKKILLLTPFVPKTAAFQTLICIFARKSSEYGIINFNKNMPAPKKYYLKRRLAKAMHSIWSQDWKSNGVMVQKSVGHKSKRKGMRSLRLVNLPDGKVRMLCQMTKRRAEELKRQGIAVELDVLGGSGYCTKDGTPHPHVARRGYERAVETVPRFCGRKEAG